MEQNYRKGTAKLQLHNAVGLPLENWLEIGRIKEFSLMTREAPLGGGGGEAGLSIPHLVKFWPK